jgi:hypothetical protein
MENTSTKGNIRHGKLKSQKELKKITDSQEYKDADYKSKNKMLNVATASKGAMMGGGKKNYKTTGMLGAKTGKLVGGQKNLPGHLKKAILA